MRLDRKKVGFFGTPDNLTSFMTAPENIFRAFKVRVPPVEVLTTSREWANDNIKELFQQDESHTEVQVEKMILIPTEWTSIFLETDMTPLTTLRLILQAKTDTHISHKFTFDPLLD